MRRDHGDWTSAQEAAFVTLAFLGARQCAEIFERTPDALHQKARRMRRAGIRISLKKSSEIDVRELTETQLDAIRKRRPDMLCPACGKALVATKQGLCGACHLQALTDAHNAAYRELVAKRDYDVAKQQLKRKRRELGVPAPHARGGDASR